MQIVNSFENLQHQVAEIRSLQLGFITNFYPDAIKHGLWIAKGNCFTERINNSLFIIKISSAFWNVFYCTTTTDVFGDDLVAFQSKHPGITMMYDIVGRENQCLPLVELFKAKGCVDSASLVRMTRMAEPLDYSPDSSIRYAKDTDLPVICQLLHSYFDERIEQIPYDEELEEYIRQSRVLVCVENGKIAGFLIFELNSTTLYLRYWFTHPGFRDHKVGSRLLRRFFEEGKNTKRQLLWVIRDNENAIVRYRHYGFAEENMYDYIMEFNSNRETHNIMKEQIIKILTELRPEFDFNQNVNFIEEGMLDSFDVVNLVNDLDATFGISIDGIDILPENFATVEAIENLLKKNGAKL